VLVQVGLEGERLVAPLALEVLESRVGLHVRPEVGPVGKALPAVSAAIGFVSGMGPHVTLQEPRPRERLAADVTLVIQVVGQDVHGKGRHGDIHLSANVALLGTVGIQTTVGLLVPGEV
jgi:hypothetical protein